MAAGAASGREMVEVWGVAICVTLMRATGTLCIGRGSFPRCRRAFWPGMAEGATNGWSGFRGAPGGGRVGEEKRREEKAGEGMHPAARHRAVNSRGARGDVAPVTSPPRKRMRRAYAAAVPALMRL